KGQENIAYINQSLRDDPQGRADRIHQTIASWFLLKKMLYVQYKELLENVLEMDDSIRVMENVRIQINKDLVANKIIRYKDVH
ncbi:hypothetical protein PT078_09185, partial [Erysipelothrix rhusiopathiae]|nr:hypothetical protein [Erysipelothrix rhusiopathiae]